MALLEILVFVLGCVASDYALSCVKCNSEDSGCEEGMMAPTPCANHQRYCIIRYVFFRYATGVYRNCTDQEAVQGCRHNVLKYGDKVCDFSCGYSGCNGS